MSSKSHPVPGAWTPPDERSSLDESPSPPPQTPPSQMNRIGQSKGGMVQGARTRAAAAAAFGTAKERLSPEARGEDDARLNNTRSRSDSHDLTWSPNRQRRSVLDNMLLSLDHATGSEPLASDLFASGLAPAEDVSSRFSSFATPTRHRDRSDSAAARHTIYHAAHETPPSSGKTRSHRSNSSLNYQTGLGRIDSVRQALDHEEEEDTLDGQDLRTPKAVPAAVMMGKGTSHSRTASNASSLDWGLSDGRWQDNSRRRSRSFDQGLMRSELFSSADRRTFMFSSAEDQATASAIYASLEAAPMPTVPGGPRRYGEPLPSPVADFEKIGNSRSRRGSLRSPSIIFTRQERSRSPRRNEPRAEKSDRPSNLRHGSSYNDARHAGQSLDITGQLPMESPAQFGSQRPGFFRRVFGSKGASAASEPVLPSFARAMSESVPSGMGPFDDPRTEFITETSQQQATPPSKDSKGPKKVDGEPEPPSLNKKPSFFRRRKKSTYQATTVPDLPPQIHPDPPQQSSTRNSRDVTATPSSLRQALNPYFTQQQSEDSEQDEPMQYAGAFDSIGRSTIRAIQRADESELVVSNSPRNQDSIQKEPNNIDTKESKSSPQQPKSNRKGSKGLTINPNPQNLKERPEFNLRQGKALPHYSMSLSALDKALPITPTTAAKENLRPKQKVSVAAQSERRPRRSLDDVVVPSGKLKSPAMKTPQTATARLPDRSPLDGPGSAKSKTRKSIEKSYLDSPRPSPHSFNRAPSDPPPPPPPTSPNVTEPMTTLLQQISNDTGSDSPTAESHPSSIAELPATAEIQIPSSSEKSEAVKVQADVDDLPTEEDREQAYKLFFGKDGIDRGEAAVWLGEEVSDRKRVREAYMQYFDWANTSILGAMRSFCSQTRLKGETQQVDRLLDAISNRWCGCNPNHGFKATGQIPLCLARANKTNVRQMWYTRYATLFCCSIPICIWPISTRE